MASRGSRGSGSRPPSRSTGGRAPPPTSRARGQSFDDDSDYTDDEEGCCKMVTRNMLWWANLGLLIAGLACLGGSIFLWVDDSLDWNDSDVAFRATIISCFIIILGLVGMQGTCSEKVDKCDLAVYIFLLGALIAAELAIVIWYFADGSDFEKALRNIWDDWSQGKQTEWMKVRDCGFERTAYVYQTVAIDSWTKCQQPVVSTATCSNPVASGETCLDVCFIDCYNEAKQSFKDFGTVTSVLTLLFALFQITLFMMAIILCCGCCGSSEYEEDSYVEPPRPPQPRPPQRGSYGRRPGGSYGGSGYGTQMARRSYGSGSRPGSGNRPSSGYGQ